LIPSVVSFADSQKPVVGLDAKQNKVLDASHTVFSAKRLLGKGLEDLKPILNSLSYPIFEDAETGVIRVQVGDRSYSAIEISALILREAKQRAEQALGCTVTRAVITVPAYFNDSQRQATRAAGRLAGLDVLRIVNEPTAASLAYGLDRKRQGLIAVYDLGGGTFDISILKLKDGIFEVLATRGDTQLGGDDLDQAIAADAAAEIQARFSLDVYSDIHVHAALLEAAERVKKTLSTQGEAVLELSFGDQHYRKTWTRQAFEARVRPLLERTQEPCMRALEDAGLTAGDLSDVVLVGGPSRLRVVQEVARSIFGREPNTSVNPDELVAEGAAIQADILSGNNRELLLLDVVPLSLGLETYGGLMSTLIARNTRIPTVAREVFTTFVENQTAVDIHVLQGEREKVSENRSLARFKLQGIQPSPAGMPRVEVTFLIDADGILQVAAKNLKTGSEQSIEVRPSYGLSDAEVEKMLASGLENSQADLKYRHLVEARNQAAPVIRAVEQQWTQAQILLSAEDLKKIQGVLENLKLAMQSDNVEAISRGTTELNQATVTLAELLLRDSLNEIR
jgi:molecular chaperone DnaK (HSP70)